MKKLLTRLFLTAIAIIAFVPNVILAAQTLPVTAVELSGTLSSIITVINTFALPIGSFLIFTAVLMVGFNILKNKDKADERSKSMESLMWLAVGAFVIGMALTIAGVLIKPANEALPAAVTYNIEIQQNILL
ncbi:MAG TPA: hypothetical protein DCP90_00630 [Clostridiales bacterium]|nr:MAG: hypothetical protein A2Y22_00530 [Clostridiales bacterium GWD2_32_59]HAN09102.1 hypothetical protein [Clostridiales bacterium]